MLRSSDGATPPIAGAPMARTAPAAPAVDPASEHPCSGCAYPAQVEIAELWLCLDCYHMYGSTCAGADTGRSRTDPVC